MRAAVLVLALVMGAGCGGPVAGLYPPRAGEPAVTVWVVAHGWHAGIAVRAADVPVTRWPERHDFPHAEYLEVGWGDRDYWQAADPGLALALSALVLPTPSVVRVIAVDGALADAFPGAEIVDLRLTPAGFERLLRFVDDSFARGGAAAATALGPASWPQSRFYPAHGSYHALRTSNTWTARALREAGIPVTPALSLTSGSVVRQVRRLSR